ncbi:MAG: translocation/assembly module TamB domain-containing protein [Legionellaceae bacterium]|nr:translocation/assembly module TamB domain-containing protein [Legionellaceae bacterium]
MKLIRALILRFVFLVVVISSIVAFLVATTPGFKLTLRITNLLLPGKLTIQQLDGHLFKRLAFNTLTYTHQKQSIALDHAVLQWHLQSLYPLNITLEALEIDQLQFTDDATHMTLDQLKLTGGFQKKLRLNGETRIVLPQGILNIHVETIDDLMTTHFKLGANHITVKGALSGPWHIHADLPNLKQLHQALGDLNSKLVADATIEDMQHATLTAHLTPGNYKLPKGSTPETLHFEGASLKAHLTPQQLNVNAYSQLDKTTSTRLSLTLPKVRLDKTPPKTQSITGTLALNINSLKFLNDLTELSDIGLMFEKPSGKINALIDISGTIDQPKFVGNIALTDGKVTLPDLGITLSPVELNVKTNGTTWESHAMVQSNNGPALTLNGKGTITPELTAEAALQGTEVIIMNTPEYQIKASPNLALKKTNDAYSIDGSILIPEARIRPVSFIHTERLTHDAVFTKQKEDPNPLNLTASVVLDIGKDVQIDLKGIQGHIDGSLHIKQLPKQALTAFGELKLRDGRYEAYGQKLDIEQGELIFLGQQIDNPNIRVRAIRHFKQTNAQFSGSNQLFDFSADNLDSPNLGENTTVGITASGRVDSPNVKLFSSPPNLSQADILSMLLLGKPADRVGKSGGQLLIQAMTSMHLNSGSKGVKMLQDLQKSIGVDFDVQNNSLGTESSDFSKTSVSVGKSITKRVYLQYNVGLFKENSSVFTLTYLLNKFLSIKVTASDNANGIDFTYSHSD